MNSKHAVRAEPLRERAATPVDIEGLPAASELTAAVLGGDTPLAAGGQVSQSPGGDPADAPPGAGPSPGAALRSAPNQSPPAAALPPSSTLAPALDGSGGPPA